jgi:hypothetical protein
VGGIFEDQSGMVVDFHHHLFFSLKESLSVAGVHFWALKESWGAGTAS